MTPPGQSEEAKAGEALPESKALREAWVSAGKSYMDDTLDGWEVALVESRHDVLDAAIAALTRKVAELESQRDGLAFNARALKDRLVAVRELPGYADLSVEYAPGGNYVAILTLSHEAAEIVPGSGPTLIEAIDDAAMDSSEHRAYEAALARLRDSRAGGGEAT